MTSVGFIHRGRSWANRFAYCVATDSALAARLLAWRVGLPVLKRTLSLPALVRLMHATPAVEPDEPSRLDRAFRIKEFLARGGRTLVSSNCLERSLVQYRLLSATGARPTLVLGARRDSAAVAGHAWVEVDKKPFDPVDTGQYVPLVVFGADGRAQHGLDPRKAA